MRAIHAILAAAKTILGLTGNKPAALAVEAADVAVSVAEKVAPPIDDLFTPLIRKTKTHAADGASVVFLQSPDMDAHLFNEYAKAIRATFVRDREQTGIDLPRVVMLPPGMTMDVVKRNAEELLHVAEYLAATNQKPMTVKTPFARETKEI